MNGLRTRRTLFNKPLKASKWYCWGAVGPRRYTLDAHRSIHNSNRLGSFKTTRTHMNNNNLRLGTQGQIMHSTATVHHGSPVSVLHRNLLAFNLASRSLIPQRHSRRHLEPYREETHPDAHSEAQGDAQGIQRRRHCATAVYGIVQ